MGKSRTRGSSITITVWSLIALGLGLGLGALGHGSPAAGFSILGDVVEPLGQLWVSALQMTVLPLVVVYLLAAIVGAGGEDSLGGLGTRAVGLFIGLLVLAGIFTLVATPPLIAAAAPEPGAFAQLQATTKVPQAARDAAAAGATSVGGWIATLLPSNLFVAATRGDVLSLLLFSVLLALAIRQLRDEQRNPLQTGAESLTAALLILVRWLLVATPIGVFALSYGLGRESGLGALGVLGGLVALQCGLMVAFTLLLYPISAVLGRVSIGAFARAILPAQIVALTTRSSIASLPALVEVAHKLRLPASATTFVLPLTVSLFKVNRTISSTSKLLFLAHVYGIPLTASTIATFVATVVVMSFSSAGLPGGGAAFKTLPAYIAAGLPIEGIVLAEAVETIPDIFKTVLNVTGDLSAATLLSRAHRVSTVVPSAVTTSESPV
jgi:Na+/H+-dicarboxylate symporter